MKSRTDQRLLGLEREGGEAYFFPGEEDDKEGIDLGFGTEPKRQQMSGRGRRSLLLPSESDDFDYKKVESIKEGMSHQKLIDNEP